MAIFGVIKTEDLVQVLDKTRIDCSATFKTPGEQAYKKIEIRPSATDQFYDVTGNLDDPNNFEPQKVWFLDWAYLTDGTKEITLKVTTTDGGDPETLTEYEFTKEMEVITEVDDKLFSTDEMLVSVNFDVLKYISEGRNSFKREHREAQKRILSWLDENGYTDTEGKKLTKDAIVDVSEVREWSKYLTLSIIYAGVSNAIDDIFDKKAKDFESLALRARDRKYFRLDYDGDGEIGHNEQFVVTTTRMDRA